MKRAKGIKTTYADIQDRRFNLYSKLTLLFCGAGSPAYDNVAFKVSRDYAHICAAFYTLPSQVKP